MIFSYDNTYIVSDRGNKYPIKQKLKGKMENMGEEVSVVQFRQSPHGNVKIDGLFLGEHFIWYINNHNRAVEHTIRRYTSLKEALCLEYLYTTN